MDIWFIKSLIALLSYSVMSFLIVLSSRKGLPTSFVLLGVGITLIIYYSIQTFVIEKYTPSFSVFSVGLILSIGILSAVANLFAYQAAALSPNPGIALAISSMQGVGVAILSLIIFKDKINTNQLIGIILSLLAITFINIGANKPQANEETTSHINVTDTDSKK